MKRFQDFLYNISDILVALAIIIVAAGLITWRMTSLVNYPSKALNSEAQASSEAVDEQDLESGDNAASNEGDVTDNSNDPSTDKTNDQAKSDDEKADETKDETKDDQTVEIPKASFKNGKLTVDITLTLKGSTATQIVDVLIQAGIFSNFNEFKTLCNNNGLNSSSVRGGTKTFTKGMTKLDIAKMVANKK